MVSTLDSHPAVRGSIPLKYLNIFIFFLVILLRKYSLIIQKVQKSTQKLFVQFRYFKLFMYRIVASRSTSRLAGNALAFWFCGCSFRKKIVSGAAAATKDYIVALLHSGVPSHYWHRCILSFI